MKTIFELFGVLVFAFTVSYFICAFTSGELDIKLMDDFLKGCTLFMVLIFSFMGYTVTKIHKL